jgi:F0F1-type ATP synthase membrane subunit b/b'
MDDLLKVTHDLVATDEGKKHIEKTVNETTAQVQKSFDDIMKQAKAEMEKAKADVEKAVNPKK